MHAVLLFLYCLNRSESVTHLSCAYHFCNGSNTPGFKLSHFPAKAYVEGRVISPNTGRESKSTGITINISVSPQGRL